VSGPWDPPEYRSLTEPVAAAEPAARVEVVSTAPLSDRAWAQAALAEHQGCLLRFAASIVGPEQAQDVVQDTFLELCRAERGSIETHLRGWLFTVCRNRAFDLQRRVRRLRATTSGAVAESPQHLLEHKQARLSVDEWLERLPERQREAVVLKFSAELSYKEIAEILETTVSNVGVLLHAALRNLRVIAATEKDATLLGGSRHGT